MTEDKIQEMFTYHPPDNEQMVKYAAIRGAAKAMARIIYQNTPVSADQTAAIRLLRQAVMTANAAIATRGAF